MLTYLSIGAAFLLLCVVGGAGFYVGARHVEELSGIVRNPDRPDWAQEPVDAFNRVVGRPTSRDPAAALYDPDDATGEADGVGEGTDSERDDVDGETDETAASLDGVDGSAAFSQTEDEDR